MARTSSTGRPCSYRLAASTAAGSRSMPIIQPFGPTFSASALACPPPPNVPSTSTAPGCGESHWSTSSNSTGRGTDDGSDILRGIERPPISATCQHSTPGASLRPDEVECPRRIRPHRAESAAKTRREIVPGFPPARTFFTPAEGEITAPIRWPRIDRCCPRTRMQRYPIQPLEHKTGFFGGKGG